MPTRVNGRFHLLHACSAESVYRGMKVVRYSSQSCLPVAGEVMIAKSPDGWDHLGVALRILPERRVAVLVGLAIRPTRTGPVNPNTIAATAHGAIALYAANHGGMRAAYLSYLEMC